MELEEFAVENGESEIPWVASLHIAEILNNTLSPSQISKTSATKYNEKVF
jgi:hypothetical protein